MKIALPKLMYRAEFGANILGSVGADSHDFTDMR
jgi:hypothetical protein